MPPKHVLFSSSEKLRQCFPCARRPQKIKATHDMSSASAHHKNLPTLIMATLTLTRRATYKTSFSRRVPSLSYPTLPHSEYQNSNPTVPWSAPLLQNHYTTTRMWERLLAPFLKLPVRSRMSAAKLVISWTMIASTHIRFGPCVACLSCLHSKISVSLTYVSSIQPTSKIRRPQSHGGDEECAWSKKISSNNSCLCLSSKYTTSASMTARLQSKNQNREGSHQMNTPKRDSASARDQLAVLTASYPAWQAALDLPRHRHGGKREDERLLEGILRNTSDFLV